MKKTIHLQTALDAYRKHVSGRTRTVIFAVDISHAERMREVFSGVGIGCEVVHSEKAKQHNRSVLEQFEAGTIPVVVNVGVMTEGWDCRGVDLILLCRPTMSAALFIQIVGRGLRTFPGKQDVLILDLAGNFNRHGPPWEPILPDYSQPGRPKEKKKVAEKECPKCGHINPAGCWCCEECGEILKVSQIEEAKSVKLRELNLHRMKKAEQVAEVITHKGAVKSMEFSKHITPRGDVCLKVSAFVQFSEGNMGVNVNHFYRLDGVGAWYFGKFWKALKNGCPVPSSIDEAVRFEPKWFTFMSPIIVNLKKDGKWWKVLEW